MKKSRFFSLALIIVFIFSGFAVAENSGRIYGKIYTVDGDILEGLIRWDKNEGNWVDILNGTKDISRNLDKYEGSNRKRYSDRGRSIKIFGLKIVDTDHSVYWSSMASSGIRFGHIKTMEMVDDDRVLLVLKSGSGHTKP